MTTRMALLGFLPLLMSFSGCGSGSGSTSIDTPAAIRISPVSAMAGSPDLELTVTGHDFAGHNHNRSFVVWSVSSGDTLLTTTFVSSTELTAMVPAALLANPIVANVLVETGDPLGSVPFVKSGIVNFLVMSVLPESTSINSISPVSAVAGSSDLTLTVMGSAFFKENHNKSRVVWSVNGSDTFLVTTFVSDTELTAVIPEALLANPVTAKVLVETGDPLGSAPLIRSNSINFTVTPP